jgi:preprotein translocase subunit SecG
MERLLFVIVMAIGVIVGVLMEEKRMLGLFSDYK